MMKVLFQGLFDSESISVIAVSDFLLCMICSLVLGLLIAVVHSYRSKYTQSFVVTLALLPAVVCVIIMMVNGNVGAGVAVAGAFSLVRFRSVPGTAKEIGSLFLAMAAGLITGMGYLGFAVLFTLILCAVSLAYSYLNFGAGKKQAACKILHVTIPEDLDYTDVFTEILKAYTSQAQLTQVKTTNMGSLFKLTYQVQVKDITKEKEFLDEIRCRNGNLEVSLSNQEACGYEL